MTASQALLGPRALTRARSLLWSRWFAVVLFLAVAVVLWVVIGVGGAIGRDEHGGPLSFAGYSGPMFLEGWARFDAGWYRSIADNGYFYDPGAQSSVAFFPAYPHVMGFFGDVFGGEPFVWGVLVTFLSGFVVVVLFHQWCRERVGAAATPAAVAALALWPYAWYLFGAVYADALFLAAVLAAFVLLERDHVLFAALAGAVATATRPVGAAVVLGLALRLLERRGALRVPGLERMRLFRTTHRPGAPADVDEPAVDAGRAVVFDLRRLRAIDPAILLAGAGLVAYVVYRWRTFDEPFAFAEAESAPGWDQRPGLKTWFKTAWMSRVVHMPDTADMYLANITFQAVLAIGLLLLVPLVVRRFGWGYGVYTFAVLAIPLIGSKDFMGLGRYALTAFPSFAVLGVALTDRPRVRVGWFLVSGALLVLLTYSYAKGEYVA
ncbi:MAG TPA: hypothetical protein VF183_01455 [Acidimicrobiales bacterium]